MELRLPKNQHRSFTALAELDTIGKERLLEILKTEPLSIALGALACQFSKVVNLVSSTAQSIFWMLHHMYAARVENELSPREFADTICRAAEAADLKLETALLESVKEFLTKALALDDTLGVVAKGITLLRNSERILMDCKIVTDFRPIFREALDEVPRAAVIVHNLRLTFQKEGETDSIYIGLDRSDLETLKACVERALEKENGLKKTLATLIPCVT
jgi:hypothetical protein